MSSVTDSLLMRFGTPTLNPSPQGGGIKGGGTCHAPCTEIYFFFACFFSLA
jgi:hypothetical protein